MSVAYLDIVTHFLASAFFIDLVTFFMAVGVFIFCIVMIKWLIGGCNV